MGYSSKGRRPAEYASKSSHVHIINDPAVSEFLSRCDLPQAAGDGVVGAVSASLNQLQNNPICHVLAVDGGYSEVTAKTDFPSSTVALFQIGVNIFSVDDLDAISNQAFIRPEDIGKLKKIQRLKVTLPVRNVTLKGEGSLVDSVRKAIYDAFRREPSDDVVTDRLIETLKWFLFEEYKPMPRREWLLSGCPKCGQRGVSLERSILRKDRTFSCPYCSATIYLTDVFRLHEAVDNELGAGGILGYVTTLIEQLLIVHLIRIILQTKPSILSEMVFLKDGPLAFFGQTANLHQPMRELCTYLFRHHNLYLGGLEKSGPFVDHADQIANSLEPRSYILLSNDYIYKYIIPGNADSSNPYARSSYYGGKVIYKSTAGQVYVVTVPTGSADVVLAPELSAYYNLPVVLENIDKLRCDMYDSSLIPIALVNKLVSLAHHPSAVILEKFVRTTMTNRS